MAREHGIVKWFSVEKGYGFIRRERGEDVFVHHSAIEGEGFRTLRQGERVEFEARPGDRGPRAHAVRRDGEEEPAGRTTARGRVAGPSGTGEETGDGGHEAAARNGDGSERRSLAAQIRERLGRRFLGFSR